MFTFVHTRLHSFTFVRIHSPSFPFVHPRQHSVILTIFSQCSQSFTSVQPIISLALSWSLAFLPILLPIIHFLLSPLLSFSPSHAVSLCRYHIAVICRHVAMTFCCYVVAVVTCRYVLFCRHCRHCRDLAGAEIPRISVPHMNRLRESPTGIAWTPPGCVGVDVRRNPSEPVGLPPGSARALRIPPEFIRVPPAFGRDPFASRLGPRGAASGACRKVSFPGENWPDR